MDFSRPKAAMRGSSASTPGSTPHAVARPERSSSMSKSASPKAPAERDPLFNYDTQLSAVEHVNLLTRQIRAYQNEVRNANKKIQDNKEKLEAIDPRLFYSHKPVRDRLEKSDQDCLRRIAAAEAALPAKEKEKKEWAPLAKKQTDQEQAAKKAAETESKREARSKKIQASHDEFNNTYKGTAHSPTSGTIAPRRSAMPFSKTDYKNASKWATKSITETKTSGTPSEEPRESPQKRMRDDESKEPEEMQSPRKKVKATNASSAISAESLAKLPRIPKDTTSPEEEKARSGKGKAPTSLSTAKADKRKRTRSDDTRDEMPVDRKAASGPKPKTKANGAMPANSVTKGAACRTNALSMPNKSSSTKKASTPPSSPGCEDEEVQMQCGFKRTFDPLGDLDFIEHELECSQCRQENPKPRGLLGLEDKGVVNTSLQLLNAALTDKQVAALAGNGTPNHFGLSETDCIKYGMSMRNKAQEAAFEGNLATAWEKIKESSKKGILLAPYVGQLLQKLREDDASETTALVASMALDAKAAKDIDSPSNCFKEMLAILATEKPFIRDIFQLKSNNSCKCASAGELTLQIIAREPGFEIVGGEQSEMEVEIKPTLQDLINENRSSRKAKAVFCQKCKTDAATEPTKESNQSPSNLVVCIDRFNSSTSVQVALEGTKVGGKDYGVVAVVHMENTGRNVAYRKDFSAWWRLSDEDVAKVKDFQVQDNLRGQWVLALLKQM